MEENDENAVHQFTSLCQISELSANRVESPFVANTTRQYHAIRPLDLFCNQIVDKGKDTAVDKCASHICEFIKQA